MLFNRKAPTSDLDAREAELKNKLAALEALTVERGSLAAGVTAATAKRERAHAAYDAVLNDPMTAAHTADQESAAAKEDLRSAVANEVKAASVYAAHVERHGDIGVRVRALAAQVELVQQGRTQAAHAALVARKIRAAVELAECEAEENTLLKSAYARWPDDRIIDNDVIEAGAGLISTGFGPGAFVALSAGGRTLFVDEFLKAIGVSHPELLELLPADLSSAVTSNIARDNARCARFYAQANQWGVDELRAGEGTILRNRTRRRYRPSTA
jgi:hypothetical protein